MICKYSFFDQQCRCFIRSRLDRSRLQPFRLIPGGHITFAIARVYTFESVRSSRITRVPSRVQTSLASIRAGWFSTALVCSPVAPEFHPPPAPDFRPADRPASLKTGLPQEPARPAPPPLRSPIHRSFPPAKFRRSAALIGATNAPLKFSAALRPSSPHPSRQRVNAALRQPES